MLSDTEDFVSVWGVINIQCNWCPLQSNDLLSDFFQRNKKLWKMCFYYSTECRYVFIHLFIFVYFFLRVLGSGLG